MDTKKNEYSLQVFLFLATLAIAWVFGMPLHLDGDTNWHLAAGREILEQGQIPKTDPWTFSSDQQWYNISWLFDIAIALLSKTLGDSGLHLLTLSLHALLVAEIFRTLPAWGKTSLEARFLAAATAAFALNNYAVLRPQLPACFLILYSLVLLQKSRTHPKLLWGLPLLTLLWANTHGSFPLLAIFFGAHGLEALLHKNIRRFQLLCLTALACSLTTLLNPLGLDIYTAISRTLDSSISQFIAEWNPWVIYTTDIFGILPLATIITIMALGIIGPSQLRNALKPQMPEKLLTLIFFVAALLSMRYFMVLALVIPPFLSLQIGERQLPEIVRKALKPLLCLSLWTLFSLTLAHQSIFYQTLDAKNLAQKLDKQSIDFLASHFPNRRVFNFYNTGGAIANYGSQPKKMQHYIDGRAGTAFSEEVLKEYLLTSEQGSYSINTILEKYQINAAILQLNSQIAGITVQNFENMKWKKVHENIKNVVYVAPTPLKHPKTEETKENPPKNAP